MTKRDLNEKVSWQCPTLLAGYAGDTGGGDRKIKDKGGLPRYARNDEKRNLNEKSLGNVLLSQGAAPQVPSALTTLTSGFEMLPGVPSSQNHQETYFYVLKAE